MTGAAGGTRTRTALRPGDFKSPVSAISPPRHLRFYWGFEDDPNGWTGSGYTRGYTFHPETVMSGYGTSRSPATASRTSKSRLRGLLRKSPLKARSIPGDAAGTRSSPVVSGRFRPVGHGLQAEGQIQRMDGGTILGQAQVTQPRVMAQQFHDPCAP
jgi:hypothetical protein